MRAREIIIGVCILAAGCSGLRPPLRSDPADSSVEFRLIRDCFGPPLYSITRGEILIVEPSPLGVIFGDGGSTPSGGPIRVLGSRDFQDVLNSRGNRSRASVRGRETIYQVGDGEGGWRLQVRTFPDGVAWRYLHQGEEVRRIAGERTAFTFPAGTELWATYQTRNYEGLIYPVRMGDDGLPPPPPREDSPSLGLPLTFRLPDGSYGAVLENSAPGYSGMTLLPRSGERILAAAFEGDPEGWEMEGEIVSSWRVVLTGPTLDALVRSDILPSLSPPPDPELFPDGLHTQWCRPGVCGWSWWAENTDGMAWEKQPGLVDRFAELGFPYYQVDVGWEDPGLGWFADGADGPWQRLEELCRYGARRGVAIWVWRSWREDPEQHWPGLETPEKREDFFRRVSRAGAVGVKLDFFDSESSAVLDYMRGCLEAAARHRLMVNFHGSPKPAGEAVTWPNEMTREGVRGLEYNQWGQTLPPEHYSRVLFTRYLAGPGDFTPVALLPEGRGETSPVFQAATGVLMTSPMLVLADLPEVYLASPLRPLLERIPAVWDDTLVLPGSEIGGLAGLVRRSGDEWWVAVINPGPDKEFPVPLNFLPPGEFRAEIWRDEEGEEPEFYLRAAGREDLLELRIPEKSGTVVILSSRQDQLAGGKVE